MVKVSKEEILYIAQLSQINLTQEEIEPLRQSIEEALSYAAKVQELAASSEYEHGSAANVLREDEVVLTDPKPLLNQVPVCEDDYVAVPAVLENE
jgi:aspartyl/glutamyl-tRNA(Asn/Gln) amidotransferase C subunit